MNVEKKQYVDPIRSIFASIMFLLFRPSYSDYTDILHLIVLSNLEVLNASMIENNISQNQRIEKLNGTARKELEILSNNKNVLGIQNLGTEEKTKMI